MNEVVANVLTKVTSKILTYQLKLEEISDTINNTEIELSNGEMAKLYLERNKYEFLCNELYTILEIVNKEIEKYGVGNTEENSSEA